MARTGPNAVELTVEQAWFIAETLGAGTFPWVLAVTPPYREPGHRAAFEAGRNVELTRMGVLRGGVVDSSVAEWIRLTCFCERWLELRYVGPAQDLMRGIIARRDGRTVVALRNAQFVTFTAMELDHPHAVVPVVVAGLDGRPPARFPEFALPAHVGARADARIRDGANLLEVLDDLGVPPSARPAVESVFAGRRTYVEIVAGERRDGRHATTEVGVSVVDTEAGRILVSPYRAADGEWVSTFAPGTPFAIAVAVERLAATLPGGSWFPDARLIREFSTRPA